MEAIYLKNTGNNNWHSEKVNLKSYFESYSDVYCKIMKRSNTSAVNMFKSLLGEDDIPDKKEMANFIQEMSEFEIKFKTALPLEVLTKPKNKVKAKLVVSKKNNLKGVQPGERTKLNKRNLDSKKPEDREAQDNLSQNSKDQPDNSSHQKTAREIVKEICKSKERNYTLSESSLNILKFRGLTKMRKAKYNKNVLTTRSEILLEKETGKSKKKDLKSGKHFVVSFRIHEPFAQRGPKVKAGNFQQEILVLGHQTLDELRDKIICQADFQDVKGDVSNDPDSLVTELTRDKYKSAMFYFDNTFYIDERADYDHSREIRNWALTQGINVGWTKFMGKTRVSDLEVRFGYPYLYKHQGGCEHLVIISSARLLTGKDSLNSGDYPLISRIPRPVTKYCFTCFTKPAKWILTGCERLPQDVTFMCHKCFKSYNYVDGKKVGKFKAYHFIQKNALL